MEGIEAYLYPTEGSEKALWRSWVDIEQFVLDGSDLCDRSWWFAHRTFDKSVNVTGHNSVVDFGEVHAVQQEFL